MRRKNLPLNALRAFKAAARLGRLTVAAEELGVTHGAVSRQVRQLESVLGVDLFGGPRSKPELTPTGQSLAPVLTAALDQIDNAVRAVLAEEEGLLQVACLSTLAMRWLIPRLHRFTQLHPGIDVRLSTDKEHIDPERGRFDLVITVIDGEEVLRARDALLFREQIGVVLVPALMPSAKQLRTSGLSSIPRLATRTRPNAWATWDALVGAPAGHAKIKPAAQFEHYYFTIGAALSGLGACVVPWHLVADEVTGGRLVAPFGFRETGYRYILRGSRPADRKSARFSAWLRDEAAAQIVPAQI